MSFKSLLLFVLLNSYALSIKANGGIFETYIEIAIDNATGLYYGTGGSNPNFNNAVLATNLDPNTQSFEILTRGINTWNDNGTDVQSARLNYRVYKQGDTPGSFITVNLPFVGQNGNDKFWNTNSPAIDLLTNVTIPATYVVEIYWEATTNDVNCGNCSSGILYESNGGNNFTATFTTSTVLPVDLLAFDVEYLDKKVEIQWTTANEINNEGFLIQQSTDGKNYINLALLNSSSNKSNNNHYLYTHYQAFIGPNYYKLSQVDLDGQVNHLGTKLINITQRSRIQLYPNPASQTINVRLKEDDHRTIHFYNTSGQMALMLPISKTLNIESLPSGIYLVTLSDGSIVSQKMVIEN